MSKPYELTGTIIDAKRIRGYESNNLIIQGETIQEYFTIKGESGTKKVIPFDFFLVGFKMERGSESSGTWQVNLRIINPKGNIENEIYFGTDGLFLSQPIGTNIPTEQGSTIFFEELSSDPSLNKELVLTAYFKRVKIIEL